VQTEHDPVVPTCALPKGLDPNRADGGF
jgi:hypothetical protein